MVEPVEVAVVPARTRTTVELAKLIRIALAKVRRMESPGWGSETVCGAGTSGMWALGNSDASRILTVFSSGGRIRMIFSWPRQSDVSKPQASMEAGTRQARRHRRGAVDPMGMNPFKPRG